MKLPGWCEKCRRLRPVTVTKTLPTAAGSAPIGVCDECEDREVYVAGHWRRYADGRPPSWIAGHWR